MSSNSPPEWPNITNDVKIHIVGFLDYGARCNLRLCSKNDQHVVDSTNFKAGKITICEWFSDARNYKTLIRIDIDNFTIWFIGKENITRIDRAWNEQLLTEYSEIKQENRHDLARNFLDKFHRKFGIIEAESINLVMFEQPPSPNWKLKCNELSLYQLGGHENQWLDQCISPGFKKVEITSRDQMEISEKILKTSESLRINMVSDMTDDQLAMVKTTDLHVNSDRITWKGVQRYLEYFLTHGSKEDEMEITIPLPRNFDFRTIIPENIEYHKTKIPEGSSSIFRALLTGGFKNLKGLDVPRVLKVRFTPEKAEIICEIPKKSSEPCQLYPFTSN